MEEALEKLKKILDLISEEDKKKLQTELAKMMPTDSNARVTTKTGWGHFNDSTQVGFDFMTVQYKKSYKMNDAFYFFSKLMKSSDLSTNKFIEAFDIILNKKPVRVKLGFIPALDIADKTKACSVNFKI